MPGSPLLDTNPLLEPVRLGPYVLKNRVVMSPMTRNRSPGEVPNQLNAEYYAQRAGAGLIVTESTAISPQGLGWIDSPGLYTPEQISGWRAVTDAVHARGGRIFVQLWHTGRCSHVSVQPGGQAPVAPSAMPSRGRSRTPSGRLEHSPPRALEPDELPGIVAQYRQAAANALAAGFDGVEVHAGNGYLLDQFLRSASNQRSDAYGGSPQNRVRLTREVVEAVLKVWGAERVGVRISPLSPTNGMSDADPHGTFGHVAAALDALGIAYLHVIEPGVNGTLSEAASDTSPDLGSGYFRALFSGPIIAAGGHDARTGAARIAKGDADLVAYGKLYIANPDLPERFARRAPLHPADRATFYGGGARGYTDSPPLGSDDLLDGDTQAA